MARALAVAAVIAVAVAAHGIMEKGSLQSSSSSIGSAWVWDGHVCLGLKMASSLVVVLVEKSCVSGTMNFQNQELRNTKQTSSY